jgi:hypothetical protein
MSHAAPASCIPVYQWTHHIFSDGAPSHYTNARHFINRYCHKDDFGMVAKWHFAVSRGRVPCDGIGGTKASKKGKSAKPF